MISPEQLAAERGLEKAISELAAAVDDAEAFIALGHALKWLHALEENARSRFGNYFKRRAASGNGQVVGGLAFARGFEHHELARWWRVGDSYTDTYTERYGTLVWNASSPAWRDKHGRDALYEMRLAKRPVIDTLREAHRFLVRELPR